MPDTALEQSSSALPGTHTEHASRHADSAHVGRRRTVVGVILIAGLALFLRAGGVDRQGLWADELFSLAIATGHSLEHPASKADLTLGDYVEAPHPLPVPDTARAHRRHPGDLRRRDVVVRGARPGAADHRAVALTGIPGSIQGPHRDA